MQFVGVFATLLLTLAGGDLAEDGAFCSAPDGHLAEKSCQTAFDRFSWRVVLTHRTKCAVCERRLQSQFMMLWLGVTHVAQNFSSGFVQRKTSAEGLGTGFCAAYSRTTVTTPCSDKGGQQRTAFARGTSRHQGPSLSTPCRSGALRTYDCWAGVAGKIIRNLQLKDTCGLPQSQTSCLNPASNPAVLHTFPVQGRGGKAESC